MSQSITFIIPGAPVPKARARVGKGYHFTPPRTVQYEALVRLCAMRARPKDWPLDAKYRLSAMVYYADNRRRDLSNVIKSIEDGMNTVIWKDDCQVTEYRNIVSCVSPRAPRVEVTIEVVVAPALVSA